MIYFRNGKLSDLHSIIKKYGDKIILVTGNKSFIQSLPGEKFIASLQKNSIEYHQFIIAGEPSPEIIDQTVYRLKDTSIDAVVGIGGGSVIDAGKAISAMMYKSGSVEDYLEGVGIREHPGTKIPFIAVPTTSGTGSEATKNAVISRIGMGGFKKSIRHDNFVPDIAIVDPELTLKCPRDITAASGMDCFTQLVEAFLSDKSNEYTDALAIQGLDAIRKSLVKSFTDGHDIEARSEMSFAALTSGICLANAGLGVVHGFASSIGGMYNIPHGVVCGTLMAPANKINVRELKKSGTNPEALKKYSILGKLFLGDHGKADEYYVDGFINYLYEVADKLEIPGFKKYGLDDKNLGLICSLTENKNNPVKLDQEDLIEILSSRLC